MQIDAEGTTVKMKSQEGMKGPDAQGFTFDRAFQMDTKQEEVYTYGISSIVDGTSRVPGLGSLRVRTARGAAQRQQLAGRGMSTCTTNL